MKTSRLCKTYRYDNIHDIGKPKNFAKFANPDNTLITLTPVFPIPLSIPFNVNFASVCASLLSDFTAMSSCYCDVGFV